MKLRPIFLLLLLAVLVEPSPAPLVAQTFLADQERRADERATAFRILNDTLALRFTGDSRIPSGRTLDGPVGVVGGSLTLGGVVLGDVVILNGDLILEDEGAIRGNLFILGGSLRGAGGVERVTGQVVAQTARTPYRVRSGRVEEVPVGLFEGPSPLGAEVGQVTLRPIVRNAGSFNRVEGLPLRLGGRLEYASRNPLEIEAAVIWRSASGFNLERERLGHDVRLNQALGGSGQAALGIRLFDEMIPIEDRGMRSVESSLSTFLLRRDEHDHFRRKGWSLTLEGRGVRQPVQPRIEYREETHRSVDPGDPWTLRDRGIPWRPQPAAATGSVRSLKGSLTLDTRNDAREPTSGWWAQGWVRRRVGGDLTAQQTVLATGASISESISLGTDGHLDVRQYLRLSPATRVRWQFQLSGALNREPLPAQYQRTLGGEGSLPGHPFMAVDCGARKNLNIAEVRTLGGEPVSFPNYGCDAVALGRIELAQTLTNTPFAPSFKLFLGAGKGWAYGTDVLRQHEPLRTDMGVGFAAGPLGMYWAWPLNERDRGLNFFIRLNPRF